MKYLSSWALGCVLACSARSSHATTEPKSLNDCYMQVAMKKQSADMVYLAREICDQVFGKTPRSLVVLDRKQNQCVEWWFDNRGRRETADSYCALEHATSSRLTLSCESKSRRKSNAFVQDLSRKPGKFEIQKQLGTAPGPFFPHFSDCLRARLK